VADRGSDREAIRNVGERAARGDAARPVNPNRPSQPPVDAGRTSGGGSLGHDQPSDDQSRIRNEGNQRSTDVRDRQTPDPLPELEP
jgi:hypothetical protein